MIQTDLPPAAGASQVAAIAEAIPAWQGTAAGFLRLARNTPVPSFCAATLGVIAILFAFGMIRLHTNPLVFRHWIREDGLVEWVTFAGLVLMCAYAFMQASAFASRAGKVSAGPPAGASPRRTWLALGLLSAFGAIEEISWGQRVFGWESPDWFLRHNAQGETNIHNLVAFGAGVSKPVFGKMLGIALTIYLLILPLLYRRLAAAKTYLDTRAVPVAQNYQIVLALVATVVAQTAVKIEGKAGEMQELAMVFLFLSVIAHPFNLPAMAQVSALQRAAAVWRSTAEGVRCAFTTLFSARVRFMAAAAAFLVAVFMLQRLAFSAAFEPPVHLSSSDLTFAWWLGFKYDLRVALLLLLPLALLSWIRPLNPGRSASARPLWLGYLLLVAGLAGILLGVDLGHYAYESRRLDATLLDQMRESAIAAGMVWETYPVIRSLAGIVVLVACYAAFLRRWMPVPAPSTPATSGRAGHIAQGVAIAFLYLLALWGKWSWYPLRWSDAYFSTSDYLAALATNPLENLFDTLHVQAAGVDVPDVGKALPLVAAQLGLEPPDPAAPSLARLVQPAPSPLDKPNVVIVFLESFSAYKAGVLGNPLNSTPHFDELARHSILFTRFYAAARTTARAIFTALFGFPDVNPIESASRNPLAVRQHTIVNAFEGYEKYYLIGGSASWGNIRGMLGHNIPGLKIYEEGSYDSPRTDVWGISDLHLLEEANDVLGGARQPFIAFIQTAGNHRPYTIPDDSRGFERTSVDAATLSAAGFDEPDALDGMRFIDHSIGHYFRLARAEPYYGRTIFILFGDHGSPTQRFPDIESELRHMHVPLVIHAPALFPQGRQISEIASSIDVLPTAASLAGVTYRNTTLGRDLLAPDAAGTPVAFIRSDRDLGLLDGEYYYNSRADGRQTLYRQRRDATLEPSDLSANEPERTARMGELCRALLETSRWLLYNNKP